MTCPAVYLYDTHIIRPWQNEEQKVDKWGKKGRRKNRTELNFVEQTKHVAVLVV